MIIVFTNDVGGDQTGHVETLQHGSAEVVGVVLYVHPESAKISVL